MKITRIDTDGNKGTLARGEFGFDLSVDKDEKEFGRVYVGTGDSGRPMVSLSKTEDVKEVQAQVDDFAYILALNLA